MAGGSLAAQLEALLQRLARSAWAWEREFIAALELTSRVRDDVIAWIMEDDRSDTEVAALCSVINRAAAQLAPFLGGLKRQLHSGTGAPFSLEKQLLLQTMACDAMAACLLLAPHCRASDEARLQLARAAIGCLVGSWRWLLDAAKARLAQDLGNLPESLGNVFQNLLGSQLELAELALGAPGFSAVIAAETAPPAELAAWLAAVVDLSKWPWPGGRAGQPPRHLLALLVDAWHALAWQTAWAAHHAAFARLLSGPDRAQLCLSAVGVLAVALALPPERRPEGWSWLTAHKLAYLAACQGEPLFQAADGASIAAAVAAAAQLLQQLPLGEPPPGRSDTQHGTLAFLLLALLGQLCLSCQQVSGWPPLGSQQRRRITAQLLAALGRLPDLLQLVAGGRQLSELAGERQQVLLRALVAAAAQIAALEALLQESDGSSARRRRQQQQQPASPIVSETDAVAWCQAACGALRCLPLVQQLHTANPAAESPVGFVRRAANLVELAADRVGTALEAWTHGNWPAAAVSSCWPAVWQLHSRLAQLVHFCAAGGGVLGRLGESLDAGRLQIALSQSLTAAMALQRIAQEMDEEAQSADCSLLQQTRRQLQAMCAAHASALVVCAARHPVAAHGVMCAVCMFGSLATVLCYGPVSACLDPALHQLLRELWDRVAQPMDGSSDNILIAKLLEMASTHPFLPLVLVAGGFTDEIVAGAGQNADRLKAVVDSLGALPATGEALAVGASSGTSDLPTANDAVVLESLQQVVAALEATRLPANLSASYLQRHILPPARRLAAALLGSWRRPADSQQQQLDAAQAAAARSCAYLRCANLGGGGGPAAGQGEGSMRCSACRAVWYCGTACSHADWRAGHQRVCKALGAARAAEKAARAAAAAADEPQA